MKMGKYSGLSKACYIHPMFSKVPFFGISTALKLEDLRRQVILARVADGKPQAALAV